MIKNFFNVAGFDAVKRIAEWIRHKFYTKAEIDEMFSAGAKYEVVGELPSTGVEGTIYLVPSSTSTSGDIYDEYIYVDGEFEKIGTTKADLTNYYTKAETNTLLDGKQASISVTTNANTPTDNDTVIMQDNGNTSTTSFLRRKLSTLWTYIKGKADGFYFARYDFANFPNDAFLGQKRYFQYSDDRLWGADQRFNVTWNTYDSETHENLNYTHTVANLFNHNFDNYHAHPQTGEYDVIRIYPKTEGGTLGWTYGTGWLFIFFYYVSYPEVSPIVRIYGGRSGQKSWTTLPEPTKVTAQVFKYSLSQQDPALFLEEIEITITGKTFPNESSAKGCGVSNICYIPNRAPIAESAIVTKYGVTQSFYGNIIAPKFQTRGGTANQFVLGDGTLQNSPIPVSKGGTNGTTALAAEYNLITKLRTTELTAELSDDYRIAFCTQYPSTTNGVFSGYRKASAFWTYIKGKITSVLGIQEGTIDGKVNLQPDYTAQQIDYSAGNVGKWQKVLRFPAGVDLSMTTRKTAMGYDSLNMIWYSKGDRGGALTMLYDGDKVRFVEDGGYTFLCIKCKGSGSEPTETYTFQILHSSVPRSDIAEVTGASPISATPIEPRIVVKAPPTTGAVSFNVNSSGTGSVAMANHNDFLGNMTAEATNGVTVTMSGATEGQIYRFVFTRNIEGGVTFTQSNVAYCTISGDVNAGDTITLTAVSNTADGWLYEQESAGIKSSDGSINVEYEGSTADLSLNLPPDVVRNNSYTDADGHEKMAIGKYAQASGQSSTAIGRSAQADGYQSASYGCFSQASGYISAAFGSSAKASGTNAVALGVSVNALGQGSVALGLSSIASGTSSIAFGHGATAGNYSEAVGYNAKAQINATVYGYEANGEGYSTAVGYQAKAGILSSDTDRPMLKVSNFEAIQFSEDGSSKFARFCETTDDVTITVSGSDYTLTPPAANKLLFVINDYNAQYMTSSVTGYAKLNGEDVYLNTNYYLTLSKVQLASNKYAVWMDTNANYLPAVITSFSILAYYTTAEAIAYTTAIGQGCRSAHALSSAIGINLFAVRGNQTVIGCGNIPDIDAFFIVGAGSNSANGKKNILKIDSNERMVINAGYVGGTQIIDMTQQTGSLSNITKAVYRIRWDGTGAVTLTLNSSGCVEGQRTAIYADGNDVIAVLHNNVSQTIVNGRFMEFMFIDGGWRAPQDPWQ